MAILNPPATLATLLGLLLSGSALAREAPLPPLQHDGAVAYLSGGIGQDEARAIEHARVHWPLTLEFAVKDRKRADFTAGVRVQVLDAHHKTALRATAQGPFLLAKLPPGHYTVAATLDGRPLHRKIRIRAGHDTRAVFVWPAAAGKPHA